MPFCLPTDRVKALKVMLSLDKMCVCTSDQMVILLSQLWLSVMLLTIAVVPACLHRQCATAAAAAASTMPNASCARTLAPRWCSGRADTGPSVFRAASAWRSAYSAAVLLQLKSAQVRIAWFFLRLFLQCFNTFGWVSGRECGL